MDKLTTDKLKIKTAQISLVIGLAIFVLKIIAYLITDSSAIFSDAAESVVHIVATGMVLYSIILSSRPPDESHLYGHGNIEYFSAGIEGILIIFAALTIIYFAVSDMIVGHIPNKLDTGTILIATSGVINLVLGYYIISKGKQTNSLALIADGKHILTDSLTSLGVVIGLVLVLFTQIYVLDPIVAILVATNIIFTGYNLIRESIGGLMMETDDKTLDLITNTLNGVRKNNLIDIHQLRFWKSSDFVFVDFHLTLPFYYNIKESHEIEEEIAKEIQKNIPSSQIRTHLDYCEPRHCTFCELDECSERKKLFKHKVEWNKEKLLSEPTQ